MATEAASGQKRKDPRFSVENEGLVQVKVPGLEPGTYGLKVRGKPRQNKGFASSVAQKVATDTAENGCERLLSLAETDPELARLVTAWPKLSAVVKRMILAALEADQGGRS